jgi:hypothetical protein
MSDIREQIKKQCFGLDDDELDTQIAYRDILDVVGKIKALIQEQVRLARIDELEHFCDCGEWKPKDLVVPGEITANRIKELKGDK